TEHIQHDRSETVDNNEDVTIHGYRTERVNKSKTETIDIAKALTIGAGYQVSVGASKNETVGISSTEEVGVLKHTIVGEKYEITVGKSQITFHANGDIFIRGDDIDFTGMEHIEIIAPKIYIDDGKTEVIKEPGMYKVKLWSLPNQTGVPYEDMPYEVYASGAMIAQGTTEKEGEVAFKLKKDVKDYAIHLANGLKYNINLLEEFEGTNDEKKDHELSMKGWIEYKNSNHQDHNTDKSRVAQHKRQG
ncbi:MAG: LEA type 2 family protein, partial [Sulfuricurvum sp.]|nr:LEA type 2 family protein [Sulfuricurvum sp.]